MSVSSLAGCTGKAAYVARSVADRVLARMQRKGIARRAVAQHRRNMRVYRCPDCGHYHIGSDAL